jgi:hypothetical protein
MNSAIEAIGSLVFRTLAFGIEVAGGVHDGIVPDSETASWPRIVVGEKLETPSNRLTGIGRELTIQIHIWSRYRGSLESTRLAAQVIALLDQGQQPGRLSCNGWILNSVDLEMNEELIEDVDQRHRILRFRIRCQPEV